MRPALQDLFNELLESTSEAMARLALSVTHDRQLAEDACQEAYLQLYRALLKASPINNYHGWLRRVVVNKALAQLAGRKPPAGTMVSLDGLDPLPARPPRLVEDPAQRAALGDALDQLPPEERNALWLKVVMGLSYSELAAVLRCSKHRAWRRVHGALAALSGEGVTSQHRGDAANPTGAKP